VVVVVVVGTDGNSTGVCMSGNTSRRATHQRQHHHQR
jgi:hypothetical protein